MNRREFLKGAGATGVGLLAIKYMPTSEYELPSKAVSEDDRLQAALMKGYNCWERLPWRGYVETVRTPEVEGHVYGQEFEKGIEDDLAAARTKGWMARNTEHWAVTRMLVDYVTSRSDTKWCAPTSSVDNLLEYPVKLLTEYSYEEGIEVLGLDKVWDAFWQGQWIVPPDQEYGARIVGAITGVTPIIDHSMTLVNGGSKDRWYIVHSDTFLMKVHPDYPRIERRDGKLYIAHRFELMVHPTLAWREKFDTLRHDVLLTGAKGDDFWSLALRLAKEQGWTEEEWERARFHYGCAWA